MGILLDLVEIIHIQRLPTFTKGLLKILVIQCALVVGIETKVSHIRSGAIILVSVVFVRFVCAVLKKA